MFDTKTIEDTQSGGKYLQPGINERVVIGTLSAPTDTYLQLKLYKEGQTIEDSTNFNLSLNGKGQFYAIKKLIHLVTKVVTREAFDEMDKKSTNLQEFCEGFNALVGGKTVNRVMFGVEEYLGKDGEVKLGLRIPLPTFAEDDSIKVTRMKYDEKNPYLYRKLSEDATKVEDLPFS